MDEYIRLRGHHIDLLANYYNEYQKSDDNLLVRDWDTKISELNSFIKLRFLEYGVDMFKQMDSLWVSIISTPDQKIEIVKGCDYICGFCRIRNKECEELEDADKNSLNAFDLYVSPPAYTSQQIIDKILEFKSRTGFVNTREMYIDKLIKEENKF